MEGKGLLGTTIIGMLIVLLIAVHINITRELSTLFFGIAIFGIILICIGGYGFIFKQYGIL